MEPQRGPERRAMPLSVIPKDPFGEAASAFVVRDERIASVEAVEPDPEVDREVLGPQGPDGIVGDVDGATAVEAECVTDHARGKTRASHQRALPGAYDVVGVAVAWPPGNRARSRWRTGLSGGAIGERERQARDHVPSEW